MRSRRARPRFTPRNVAAPSLRFARAATPFTAAFSVGAALVGMKYGDHALVSGVGSAFAVVGAATTVGLATLWRSSARQIRRWTALRPAKFRVAEAHFAKAIDRGEPFVPPPGEYAERFEGQREPD